MFWWWLLCFDGWVVSLVVVVGLLGFDGGCWVVVVRWWLLCFDGSCWFGRGFWFGGSGCVLMVVVALIVVVGLMMVAVGLLL